MEQAKRFAADRLADLDFFIENPVAPLFIAPEDGPIAKFTLRKAQKKLTGVLNRQWFTQGHVRMIVCKARRIGCTTLCCADAYRNASLRTNMNVVIGAQLDDMAERIHERNHIFHNNYPPSLRPERWGRSRSFKEPMEFRRDVPEEEMIAWERGAEKPDAGLQSSISIFTERTPLARTGATIQYLLLSEFAKYRNQSTIIKEMFPTVRKGTGAIIIDTTAESRGDSYSRLWEEAVAGRSEFEPVFIGWLDDEQQCHMPPQKDNKENFYHWMACQARNDTIGIEQYAAKLAIDEDEHDLLTNFIVPRWANLSPIEQDIMHPFGWIEWRRWAIQDRCDGKVQVFKNQYPTHWREAFFSSTMTIFDMSQIATQAERIAVEPRGIRGELISTEGRRAIDVDPEAMMSQVEMKTYHVAPGSFRFEPENFGPIRIYEDPIPGEEYIVSSDYAEGQSENCDYNTIHVYKRGETLEQVAHFHEKCYPEECASEAIALGAYYNMAWQIPEVNSCGAAALSLFRACYPLDRIFRRKAPDRAKKSAPTDLMGWRMTGRSKAEAVSAATTYFKQGSCVLHNPNSLRELEVFVKKDSRMLPEAMDGTDPITGERYHDDEVICMVLAIYGNRQLPYRNRSRVDEEQGERKCSHAVVAGGRCLRCRETIPQAQAEELTFDKLRSMVRDNTKPKHAGRQNEALRFWTGEW